MEVMSEALWFYAQAFGVFLPALRSTSVASKSVAQLFPTLQPHGLYSPLILQAGILEWVAFPFSRGSYQPRDRTHISCITGRFFSSWPTRDTLQDC